MIHLLGIPYDKNSSYLQGSALAPTKIRMMDKEGSSNRFSEYGDEISEGITFRDLGDMQLGDLEPAGAFKTIREKITGILNPPDQLICLGGDHSISWPVIDAFTAAYPELHILHFDAHTDLYHNFEDNPYSHASPFARLMESGKIASLTQVGIRTLTAHQRKQAERFGVNMIEMKAFSTDFLNHLKSPLYISLDMDVLDPAFAPGVSHHEPGGFSTRELIDMIQRIKSTVAGADIVEYNPARDVENITAMAAYKLFKEIAGVMMRS